MLTADNALWIGLVLTLFAAAWAVALLRPEPPTDWPGHIQPAPVLWSTEHEGYVCARPAPAPLAGICGWPATAGDCPDHGVLVDPDAAAGGVR